MSLKADARKFGQMVASKRGALHQFALAVVRAASEGEIEPDDAHELYVEYYKAARNITKVQPDMPGIKQNVSKLRQLIKLGQQRRKDALSLMRRVEQAHEHALRGNAPVMALYAHMIEAARAQLASAQPLTDRALGQLALKKSRSR